MIIALLIQFFNGHVEAFLFREAVGGDAAGGAVQEAELDRFFTGGALVSAAAPGQSCAGCGHEQCRTEYFPCFFPVHIDFLLLKTDP